jgi:ATP-dependent Zn protease
MKTYGGDMLDIILKELNTNQFLTAGVATAMTSGIVYYLKGLPKSLIMWIWRNITTTITVNNSGYVENITYTKLENIISNNLISLGTKNLSFKSIWSDAGKREVVLGIGKGYHLARIFGKTLLLHKTVENNSISERVREEITIISLGRSANLIDYILQQAQEVDHFKEYTTINFWDKTEWKILTRNPKTSFENMAISEEFLKDVMQYYSNFFESKQDYLKLNLPHKITTILHGVPGTGKSSLVRAVAGHFGFNVCTINLKEMSDKSLMSAVHSMPEKSLLLIEDFDSCTTLHDRSNENSNSDKEFLTLQGFLNALDGVVSLNGVLVFLTTNHLENMDPAVYRKGRVDKIIEIGRIDAKSVEKYFKRIYLQIKDVCFTEMLGCEINSIVFEAKTDYKIATKLLEEKIKCKN